MRYVLDSCVGIKWLVAEADSDRAIAVRDEYARGGHELLAPDIYPAEVAHAITRAERQLRITPAEGQSHLLSMLQMLPVLHPYLPLLPRAYAISSAVRIGVYDCLYVALAEREGCGLITADQRLVNALGAAFPFLVPLSSLT